MGKQVSQVGINGIFVVDVGGQVSISDILVVDAGVM